MSVKRAEFERETEQNESQWTGKLIIYGLDNIMKRTRDSVYSRKERR